MYYKLFEYGVWKTTFNSDLKEFCYKIQSIDKGRNKSNVNGWQSSDLDKSQEYIKPLISHITKETNTYAKNYFSNPSFKLDNMWVNINPTHSYNRQHTHPGSMFSGVYYIQTPKNCGNIYFERPQMDLEESFDWKYNKGTFNSLNSLEWWMPSTKHICYIFPSYMRHYVEPNRSDIDRISISFNLL